MRNVLAAADYSVEGRAAILAAARLAQRCQARLTVLTVVEIGQGEIAKDAALRGLTATVDAALAPVSTRPPVDLRVALGLPGVEIGRFAERSDADLIVIGRKRRSDLQRRLLGDTADAVARRSSVPCLFVAGEQQFERVMVGLDGTERGLSVLVSALGFTRDVGAELRVVTVETNHREDSKLHLPTGRSARLVQAVDELRNSARLGRGRWDPAPNQDGSSLMILRGPIVGSLIREVTAFRADVLVVGNHRGGPAGVIEGGSTARRLAHETPCAVLTIPL